MSTALADAPSAVLDAPHHARADTAPLGASLLRFITCGSVDDGKSTLIGRLLFDSKAVFDDQLEALGKDSKRFGTQGDNLDLALLVDGLSAEREQGITIDVAYRYFATPRRSFIVADTPGHEQYTRNMATGASTAELAVILIDARKGILPQTRRHSFIVSMLGVRHIAVAVNKMDLVGYDQATFDRICAVYKTMAKDLGFAEILFFPISARDGDNVARLSPAMPWYRGRTLLDHLETAQIAPEARAAELLYPVQWVNRPDASFRGYSGLVARGSVRAGDAILVLPRRSTARIERIVTADGDLAEAIEGEALTLTLDREIDVSRGDVIVAAESQIEPRRSCRARLLWTSETPLDPDAFYHLEIGATLAQARVKIEHTIDIHSFAPLPTQALTMNGIALATVSLDRDVVALPYSETRELGGFILIDKVGNETVAFGLVQEDDGAVAASEATARRDYAARVGRYFVGPGQADLPEALFAYFGGVLVSAVLVLLLTRSIALAALFALVDALARPWIEDLARRAFAAHIRRSEELNSDGGGI